MENKPKYKISIISVVIIFLLIYLGELTVGAGFFLNFILPKIISSQKPKVSQQISQNIINEQSNIYNLIKRNQLKQASSEAQLMLIHSKNSKEQALSLQVIGEVFIDQLDYTQAKMFFTKSLNLNQNLPGVYIGLALINNYDKDYKQAITNVQKAINLNPNKTDYYYYLGIAYFGYNDKFNAIKYIEKAVQGNPNNDLFKKTLEQIKNGTFSLTSIPSDSPKSLNHNQQLNSSGSSLGYSKQDIDNLIRDLNQADQDYKNIQNFKGNSFYNQHSVNKIIQLISQRKSLAQKLLDKMNKDEKLVESDFAIWEQLDVLTGQQNTLVNSLYNSNGGF